ncbi:MAG: aminotransferase class I/II-fold pyridoxal phosphate-dependent enzyme [Gammaproteobacteria bacterium]|nr:aminotransferase class I/II-fold pyridoxal phosphate-dependent enzyme [Gammaproteobacteria bacterium]
MKYLGMIPKSQCEWIKQLNDSKYLEHGIDSYSQGELVDLLETRVSQLLGKPKALFFNKGMTAQFCTLKVVQQFTNNDKVAFHPLSHMAFDEQSSVQHLLNLHPILIGEPDAFFSLDSLSSMSQIPATVIFELPLRRSGFRLPNLESLKEMVNWCRSKNIHSHMDGARLWESAPFYQSSPKQLAEDFDSVYVSLYKGLGAMGGAILAGEENFINQCKIWRTRFSGDHYTLFPFIVSALDGLDRHIQDFQALAQRAQEIAQLLRTFESLTIAKPQTNGFHILFNQELSEEKVEQLNNKAIELSKKMNINLFRSIIPCPYSDRPMIEIQVCNSNNAISDEDIIDYFNQLLSEL